MSLRAWGALLSKYTDAGDIAIGTVRKVQDKEAFENSLNAEAHVIDLLETDAIGSLIDLIEIIDQFNVNFIAVWKLCQRVLPYMREKGQGTIVCFPRVSESQQESEMAYTQPVNLQLKV